MQTAEISLETRGSQVFDLTDEAASFGRSLGDGLLSVFAPHATVGVALMELGHNPHRRVRLSFLAA